MSNILFNYKTKIYFLLFVGFIIISTITAISIYSMYQFHYTTAYRDADRIVRLYENSFNNLEKDLGYLRLINFKDNDKIVLEKFKTISKILHQKNSLVNGVVLIKQFEEKDLKKEQKQIQVLFKDPSLTIRPINSYLKDKELKQYNSKYITTVYHREPSIMKKDIIGVNVSSEKNRYESISKMNFSQMPILTAPIEIVNGSNGYKNSTILYYPLYKEEGREFYKWILAVPITYNNIIDKLKVIHPFINDYIIELYDSKAPNKNVLCKDINECDKKFTKLININFPYGQRDNRIVIGIDSIYSFSKFWQAILGFNSGLLFLMLIGYYLFYKEKKQHEVKELESKLLKAQEISKIGHFTWNVQSKEIICSNEIVDMFKLSSNVVKYDELTSKYYQNDIKKMDLLLERLKNNELDINGQIEYRILVDGEVKWLLTKYNALYDTKTHQLKDIFGVTQDITIFKYKEDQLQKQTEVFRKLATIDRLTGVNNRAYFDEYLGNHIEEFKRYNKYFSIILFDIDHFKNINDDFGHDTGDDVLIRLTSLVKKTLRKSDIFARWGGEEFVILLPNINLTQSQVVAEKLRVLIQDSIINEKFMVTCSFGVTMIDEEDDSKSLFKRVDNQLYEAKNTGRNKVVAI